MIRVLLVFLLAASAMAGSATLESEDLIGTWVPSGEMPRAEGVAEYAFAVQSDMSATYKDIGNSQSLECDYKPSNSQKTIFVWYCYLNEKHLITLSLGGWSSESGALLYGYEYWLGHPKPGQIHVGLPVSLNPANL